MSSPILQIFCCKHDTYRIRQADINSTVHEDILDLSGHSLMVFNILCLVSSFAGVCGALWQLWLRRSICCQYRNEVDPAVKVVMEHSDLVGWLTFADALASLGIIIRSVIWLAGLAPHFTDIGCANYVCIGINAWIQYFYMCTYVWMFMFAFNLCVMARNAENRRSWLWIYHTCSWLLPAILSACGLIALYWPSIPKCVSSPAMLIPNYILTNVPLIIVLVAKPVIYAVAFNYSYHYRTMGGTRELREDEMQRFSSLKFKYLSFVIVYYCCWLPNIVLGVLVVLPAVPMAAVTAVLLITAVTNPAQPLLLCLTFYRVGTQWPGQQHNSQGFHASVDTYPSIATTGSLGDGEQRQLQQNDNDDDDANQLLIFGDSR